MKYRVKYKKGEYYLEVELLDTWFCLETTKSLSEMKKYIDILPDFKESMGFSEIVEEGAV